MDKRTCRKVLKRQSRRCPPKTTSSLAYNPAKDKGKFTAGLRRQLQTRTFPAPKPPSPKTCINVGAININGLSLESSWALEQIITNYDLKVIIYSFVSLVNTTLWVLGVSETHFREDQNQESIDLDGFLSWRVERSGLDKRGGGLCLYYHQSLTAHCWVPTVPPHLASSAKERQWLLLPGPERLPFLHVYIACQTNQNDGYIE